MEDKRPLRPQVKGYDQAYELSYQLARQRLAANNDVARQCRLSGGQYRDDNSRRGIVLTYMGRPYTISLPEIDISPVDDTDEIPLKEKLLILHYFNTARGTPPTNRLITFRELPDGPVYSPTFTKRTVKPIVDRFGRDPEGLLSAAARIGGHRVAQGDTGVAFDAFPKVSVTMILWKGDEEFPPDGNVLLDANVADYLPTEDITILCETIAWKLVRSAA